MNPQNLMNYSKTTIDTYDKSAKELAEYFRGIGPRIKDIELALELAGAKDRSARVVEIGCGDGRDAQEIIKRTAWYEGFDPSNGLLELARRDVSNTSFVTADAMSYQFPKNLDVVYAFASLLHVNKKDFGKVCQRVLTALKPGGIFFISVKERSEYAEEAKKDQYGERMFYFYNATVVRGLMGDGFVVVHEDHQKIGHTDWMTIALRKA